MRLALGNGALTIRLRWWERLLAVHPDAFMPPFIKAGTYVWWRRREFWLATRDKPFLTIECDGGPYTRLVLTLPDAEAWAERINAARG
jgi:hypothetical protein